MTKLESIYETMGWNKEEYQRITKPTTENAKDSRSFCVLSGENALTALKRVFCIEEDSFDEKFKQACSGSGQEERRITVLHSSSLCALLFFYNITEKHPLRLYVESVGEVVFQDVIFEYQNCVVEGANPSNIDVTLLGKYNGKNVILFLESKFSEYITCMQKKLNVSYAYLREEMSRELYEKWPWDKSDELFEKEFSISISEYPVYLAGLKQMISHYAGIRKFERGICRLKKGQDAGKDLYNIKNNKEKQEIQERLRKFALEGDVVLVLGSIIFDVYKNDERHTELQEYETLYTKLMKCMAQDAIYHGSDIKILTKAYTYQQLFGKNKNRWSKEIREFYFGKMLPDYE